MRYDFSKMDADSFELMVRSLNEKIFGVKCEQFGLGPDGQREFTFEGTVKDCAGVEFQGRTIGQVKYRYITTAKDDYKWLTKEIDGELKRFREKEKEYRPDNYFFYTNLVLTPAKDTGTKDKINAYVKAHNDIIPHFYVKGYDEICALLDNNRDVAASYASHILPGDVLMKLLTELLIGDETDYLQVVKKYLFAEFEEEMYTRLEQAGSMTEKKISIERVCVDIDVADKKGGEPYKLAKQVFRLGNKVLGHKKTSGRRELERDENFVLIGGPGNGKSTICQFIAQIYRACYLKKLGYTDKVLDGFWKGIEENYEYEIHCARIPFKIALREYAAWMKRRDECESVSVMDYMQDRIRKKTSHEVPLAMLRKLLGMQAWIFFFDGLDEVPESSNRQEVLRQLRFFIAMELQEMQCDCMVVATTRAQGYNHDFDERKYQHVEVAEFSRQDCGIYIRRLFEVMEEQLERREECIRIMEEAMKDETISRLMETPLQASIIAILVKSGGKPPHERYSLFRQYYETMVKRERQKGIVATLNDNMDWLEEIHYMVGYRLQCESEREENPSAEISEERLRALIKAYVEDKKDDFYEPEQGTEEKEEEFFMTITRRLCFLCENRDGFYSFAIRSIQEYFAGTCLVKDKSDGEAMENIRRIAYSSYWRNVLLFALGYIELERKSLEKEIGLLCQQMNGADNIEKADYTSENVCLFGSWLAVDILAEDIFRGKEQNKYVKLAAEAVRLAGCAEFGSFSLISGAQKDKLLRYVKENRGKDEKGLADIFKLYYELGRNKKNDMTQEMINALDKSGEEQRIEVCLHVLEDSAAFRAEMVKAAKRQIADALEKGKIKKLLPAGILAGLIDSVQGTKSKELAGNFFLHCLYNRNSILKIEKRLGMGCSMEMMQKYLAPQYSRRPMDTAHIKLTKSMDVELIDRKIRKWEVEEVKKEVQRMGIKFLVDFCDFLLQPSFESYRKLYIQCGKENQYLVKAYRRTLRIYVSDREISNEEEFQEMMLRKEEDYTNFRKGNYLDKLYSGKTDVEFAVSIRANGDYLGDLIEEGRISGENGVGRLNDRFLGLCIYGAAMHWGFHRRTGAMSNTDVSRFIQLVYEAEQRKYYDDNIIYMIELLIAFKHKKQLWEQLPDFLLADEMIEQGMFGRGIKRNRLGSGARRMLNTISREELENAIGDIVHKVLYDEKENNYLSMIPFFIERKINIRKCITEADMRNLEQMEYTVEANLLAVKLLRMCVYENENPEEVLEDILSCSVLRKTMYEELENMLYYCDIENREGLLTGLYWKLEGEDFEEKQEMGDRILNFILEQKCSGMEGL